MRLRPYRVSLGLDQRTAAAQIGITQQNLSRLENGGTPNKETAVKIYRWSRGAVTPNDWYDLPPLDEPAADGAAA